ncbi:hypothetical protein HMPREF1216_00450 [Coprococcus sp. HPP0048]|nr:hypothetical protein HMPREF1216_00450 [Coprococcus sp. HPP0048]DAO65208.1 MAG TPA: hypothetical protein [Caudoviricetes sp.]
MELTKDADRIFCLIYKEYLSRKKSGFSKDFSISFECPEALHSDFLQEFLSDDIHSSVRELSRNNMIRLYVDGGFKLSDKGIIYMENRFKNGIKEILEYISLIK